MEEEDSLGVLASAASALYPSSSAARSQPPVSAPAPASDASPPDSLAFSLPDNLDPTLLARDLPVSETFDPDFLNALSGATSSDASQHRSLAAFERRVETALQSNAQYQSVVLKAMDSVCKALDRCKDLVVLVNDVEIELRAPPDVVVVAPGAQQPSLPYFKHLYGREFPESANSRHRDEYLSFTRPVPWTNLERETLRKAVLDWNKTRPDAHPAEIKNLSDDDLLMPTHGIDWDYIAQQIPRRSATECKIRWTQHDHPSLNRRKWTHEESERLQSLAQTYSKSSWAQIAAELGTSRTPVDCVKQYRILTESKRDWTPEEDARLHQAIKLFGKNWQAAARHVGRPSNQCINRWSKSLAPNIVKGKWSPEEDAMLQEAVAACGTVWKDVATRVPGRTDAQCRERWVNLLDPKLIRSKWTPEEDATLLELHEQGLSWVEISNQGFNGSRTDNHCLRRYAELDKRRKVEAGELPVTIIRRGRPPGRRNKTTAKNNRAREEEELEEPQQKRPRR